MGNKPRCNAGTRDSETASSVTQPFNPPHWVSEQWKRLQHSSCSFHYLYLAKSPNAIKAGKAGGREGGRNKDYVQKAPKRGKAEFVLIIKATPSYLLNVGVACSLLKQEGSAWLRFTQATFHYLVQLSGLAGPRFCSSLFKAKKRPLLTCANWEGL